MGNTIEKPKKNLGESIRQRLKNLSEERNRPFDEILRYYAMERFLYRLSISSHAKKFFLKGGLMLKVWDSLDHRATMDIDLLARTSNQIDDLDRIITEVSEIACEEDGIAFDTQKLILRNTQTGGDYNGVSSSFSAKLFTTKMPVLIDIGFNDIIIPKPQQILYPTLLDMPKPTLLGYTLETVIAEKLESVVKLALVNTRMKDFYDLWTILKSYEIKPDKLSLAIREVFANRKTPFKYPVAFTPEFYDNKETQQRWNNFLSAMGKQQIKFEDVVLELSKSISGFFEN
ncbi:MAG: nucleotidyl transferase AbiEii/AbiGii toxin family protein [Chlamydiae bacterium]|nr:nucleotidyl transferase AbiEii/AbiGii toxin family protein [Chlamydiota bacterium]